MERILQILAAGFLIAAAYFFWRGVTDWSFACGVLAACSFFLSMRFQIKERVAERIADEIENYDDGYQAPPELIDDAPADNMEKAPANTTLHS